MLQDIHKVIVNTNFKDDFEEYLCQAINISKYNKEKLNILYD